MEGQTVPGYTWYNRNNRPSLKWWSICILSYHSKEILGFVSTILNLAKIYHYEHIEKCQAKHGVIFLFQKEDNSPHFHLLQNSIMILKIDF